MHSALAPQSQRTARPPNTGITGPIAARRRPRIRLTTKVAPASSAPVEPAETKASPWPSLRRFRPTVREESFFTLKAVAGSSQISTTSLASRISTPLGRVVSPQASTHLRMSAARPTSKMSTPKVLWASNAPWTTAAGALSPPMASTMIFMPVPPLSAFQ